VQKSRKGLARVDAILKSTAMPHRPVWSLGSAGHSSGSCKPCPYFWKPASCRKGLGCEHCHLCDIEVLKVKKEKDRRMRRSPMQQLNGSVEAADDAPGAGVSKRLTQRAKQTDNDAAVESGPSADLSMSSPEQLQIRIWSDPEQLSQISTVDHLVPFNYESERSTWRSMSDREPSDLVEDQISSVTSETKQSVTQISAGSVGHFNGTCKPCAWFWKSTSCNKGIDCEYCHLCDEAAMQESIQRRKTSRAQRKRKGNTLHHAAIRGQIYQ
jgi:hypothetical protein